jgi:ribosomal 30S subunit maturation factor RimM
VLETIWELPGHHVFVVTQDGREVLIPAVKEFVKAVDLAQRRMVVRRIDGMVEV